MSSGAYSDVAMPEIVGIPAACKPHSITLEHVREHPAYCPASTMEAESILPLAQLPRVRLALILEALWYLLLFDVIAHTRGFASIYRRCERRTAKTRTPEGASIDTVCAAVNRACGYYPRAAACLQRSAVTVWMLHRRGRKAELVIGIIKYPFRSHAWVESAGRVINDSERVRELFLPLSHYGESTA